MKNKETIKRAAILTGLSAACLAVLVGAHFLAREPDTSFSPSTVSDIPQTGTWEEETQLPTSIPEEPVSEPVPLQAADPVLDEDPVLEHESPNEPPSAPPVTNNNNTDPDHHPEYTPDQITISEKTAPSNTTDQLSASGTPVPSGQVYDPVFGWIDVGTTSQDCIDSSGDINKQIGTMSGN